jgi:hypothetical protein
VVELLAGDVAADRPRRHDERRDPDAAADRKAVDELGGRAGRGQRRDDVVEQAVVLVVVDDEDGL